MVLAAKIGTQDQAGLFADDSRGGHIASGVQYPAYQMPVIVGEKETILNHLKKLDGKSVTFALQGVQPSRYEGLQLVPFHRLYECRYSVYFPLVSEQEFKAQQEKITQAEKERAAIENVTIDKIVCGEQQPESDHFIKMQNSYAGVDNGVHWREARGWFSYQMKNRAKDATKVRVLFRQEKEREGNILVNGQKIGSLAGSGRDAISTVAFDIPLALRSEIQLEVKFESVNSRTTPRVYEIRLTNQK